MELISKFDIPAADTKIKPSHKIGLIGSCFSDHISQRLNTLDFDTWHNPLGTLYNPYSIAKLLRSAMDYDISGKYLIAEKDVFIQHGLAFTTDYAFRWLANSGEIKSEIQKLDPYINRLHNDLLSTNHLFITWGTSIVYRQKHDGKIAGNCHKLPSAYFIKDTLSYQQIVEEYSSLINGLLQKHKGIHIVITISPVRHWKDGFIENQESKAVLLLAKAELCRLFPGQVSYFPSYEIMMDELRDYRFYDRDLYHPNGLAIDYIFERFGATYFSDDTLERNRMIQAFKSSLHHNIQYKGSDEYLKFSEHLQQQAKKLDLLLGTKRYSQLAASHLSE